MESNDKFPLLNAATQECPQANWDCILMYLLLEKAVYADAVILHVALCIFVICIPICQVLCVIEAVRNKPEAQLS